MVLLQTMHLSQPPWLLLLHCHLQVYILLLILLLTTPSIYVCSAGNCILSDQPLKWNQTIVSEGGNFVLGFFSPGTTTQNHYLGIWYGKVSKQTIVWIANRENPLNDPSTTELRISGDGNLVLIDKSKTQIWSTSTTISPTSNSTVAVLLDTGNLELRDGSNPSTVLWQSFDHPTDTWLPGGKLGMDKITGQDQLLTSWKNSKDPSPGPYSLSLNPIGTSSEYFIRWNMSQVFWSSGAWNGDFFSNVPEMSSHYIYTFKYVDNHREKYFTYYLVQPTPIITRMVMDWSGQIKQLTWLDNSQEWNQFWSQPRVQCDVYSLCGYFGICNMKTFPYCSCLMGFGEASPNYWNSGDHGGGCVRKTPLKCSTNSSNDKDQDGFYPMIIVRLPENPRISVAGSLEECHSSCLGDCSCIAYSFGSNGCSMWHGGLLNLQQPSEDPNTGKGVTLYLRLAASEFPAPKSKNKLIEQALVSSAVGLGIGIFVVSGFLAIFCLLSQRRRAERLRKLNSVDGSLVSFSYSDLQVVTKNFSDKLGTGGFGMVFKGTLPDSTAIAVKRLGSVTQGEKQFRAEVCTVGRIQHINLVSLRGFCSQGSKRLLVYEYMPMGSLDTVLFQNSSLVLDWKTRYNIAVGIARGLAYLHEECRDCIIHCDIKPENILLDDGFVPKVADFGLAKLVGRDFSRVLTTIRGTVGYLAPEFLSGTPITAKADVYSYGMVLLELVSGQRNRSQSSEGNSVFFPLLAVSKVMERQVSGLLDTRLGGDANFEEVDRVCRIACWCIQDEEDQRPTMGQVVQILEGVVNINMPPVPRSLHLLGQSQRNINFYSEISSYQSSELPTSSSQRVL